jgi:hypothetical protein
LGKDGADTLHDLTDRREFKTRIRIRIMGNFNLEAVFDLEHDFDQVQGLNVDFVQSGLRPQRVYSERRMLGNDMRDFIEYVFHVILYGFDDGRIRIRAEDCDGRSSGPALVVGEAEFRELRMDTKGNGEGADDGRFGIYLEAEAVRPAWRAAPRRERLVARARKSRIFVAEIA